MLKLTIIVLAITLCYVLSAVSWLRNYKIASILSISILTGTLTYLLAIGEFWPHYLLLTEITIILNIILILNFLLRQR